MQIRFLLCSGCSPSRPVAELTLTALKMPLALIITQCSKVSCARCSKLAWPCDMKLSSRRAVAELHPSGYDAHFQKGACVLAAPRHITAKEVQRLTGLTSSQLREWTNRRCLILPDLLPSGPGTRARYSWQTVLVLRLAVSLKGVFHVELQAHQDLFAQLSAFLSKRPFHSLAGQVLIIHANGDFELDDAAYARAFYDDAIVLCLDSHLNVLSAEFEMTPFPIQRTLFPATRAL